jgi:diguanylate cyclase (GGDEF)-like protein
VIPLFPGSITTDDTDGAASSGRRWRVGLPVVAVLAGWSTAVWFDPLGAARLPWEAVLIGWGALSAGAGAGICLWGLHLVGLAAWLGQPQTPAWHWSAAIHSALATLSAAAWLSWQHHRWDRDRRNARRDRLTGLMNRQALLEVLSAELSRARRFDRCFALAVLDADGFKQLNDQLGHLAGDRALQCVAKVLTREVRAYDAVARWGGDEFVVLLSEARLIDAEHLFERIVMSMQHEFSRGFPQLSCSVGVAAVMPPIPSAEDCLRQADQAMYAAKAAGGNRAVFVTVTAESPERAVIGSTSLDPAGLPGRRV